jgi:hypothetical protein
VNLGAPGELGEDRMEMRISERADVGHLDAEAGQRVGHDRAVAAQLGALVDQFDVRAAARGACQALGQRVDGGQTLELFGVLALVHHMDDLIHKTIQADKGAHPAGTLHPGQKAGGGLFAELFRLQHGED